MEDECCESLRTETRRSSNITVLAATRDFGPVSFLTLFDSDNDMDSIIEVQRQNHEEIERFERALYTILSRPQNVHQTRLQNEHKAAQILDRISSRVVTLNNHYQDEDVRKAEIDALSAPNRQNDLSEFYSRLGKIQEHHNKYPDAGAAKTKMIKFRLNNIDDEERFSVRWMSVRKWWCLDD